MAQMGAEEFDGRFVGRKAKVIAEATPFDFLTKSGLNITKWHFITDLGKFEFVGGQLRNLKVDKDFGRDTLNWIGKDIKFEEETNKNGYKQYVIYPALEVTTETVK